MEGTTNQGCLLGSILLTSLVAVDILLSLLGISKKVLGLAQWYHLAILGLENSYTSGEATSIGI